MTSVLEEWSPHVNEPPAVWYEDVLYCGSRYATATGAVVEVPRVGRGWQGDRKMNAWIISTAVAEARRRRNVWLADQWETETPKNMPDGEAELMCSYILQGARRLP